MTTRSICEDGLVGRRSSSGGSFVELKSDDSSDLLSDSEVEASKIDKIEFSSLVEGADESSANFLSEVPNHQ